MNDTEKLLIRVIAKMQLKSDGKKLLQKDVLEKVTMSRVNFNKRYSHLNDYIKGKKDILPLLQAIDGEAPAINNELLHSYKKKSAELALFKEQFTHKLETEINKYVTSLMMNDKVYHDSDDIRQEIETMAIHNDSLSRKLKEMELEYTKLKALSFKKQETKSSFTVSSVEPDLRTVFDNFYLTEDEDVFEVEKERAIEKMSKSVRRLINSDNIKIVILLDRYLCTFEKFLSSYFIPNYDSIVIRLPLFSREEVNRFISTFKTNSQIDIFVPICDSDTVTKGLRKFFMGHIPNYELEMADHLYIPSHKEGYSSVTVFRTKIDT